MIKLVNMNKIMNNTENNLLPVFEISRAEFLMKPDGLEPEPVI
jgi:hypothetical protein